MTAAARGDLSFKNFPDATTRNGYCPYPGTDSSLYGFAASDYRVRREEDIQPLYRPASGYGQDWWVPTQRRQVELPEPIRKWLSENADLTANAYGKLGETVWCDLGEVLLFVIGKHSLEEERTWQRLMSGAERQQTLAPAYQEADQELESRIFANLWLHEAEVVTTVVEDGGRLDPVRIVTFGDEASNNEE